MHDVKQFSSDKILHHLEEVIKWKNGLNPYAITTEIDPTNNCNHNCPGCAGWLGSNNKDSLNISQMRACIWEIKKLGGKAITFTGGGEPLVNPDTISAIDFARYCGLDVGLVTNGTLINRKNKYKLIANCTWIRISLDAGSPRIHKRTHGTNDFYKILDNIELLVEAKKKLKSNCTIGIGYLTGANTNSYRDMMDFVKLAIELEVDYGQFRPYHTAAKKDLTNGFGFVIDFIPFVEESNDKTKILYSKHKYDCIRDCRLRPEYTICYGHQFATVITATGDMTICCHTRGLKQFTLGNVKNEFIEDIWNGEKRMQAIAKIKLDKCPALCRANTFNYILYELSKEKEHINFL